jgi:hypothetical protein
LVNDTLNSNRKKIKNLAEKVKMNNPEMAAMALEHWKEFYPEHYQAMKTRGDLQRQADASARLTRMEMDTNKLCGMTEQQAWEAAKGIFILAEPGGAFED